MKKNIISAAVAATLLGASAANAVFVNPEGHGQVLIYPYYTVEGGHDTYINLVNTTNETKAVKVRFVEAMNSQEVLDFNLYLSPRDHWSAVVFASGEGAAIKTADTSCTVPNRLAATAPGVVGETAPFRNFEYNKTGETFVGLNRTREGYVEIIEMGVVDDAAVAASIKHDAAGIPDDCSVVQSRWAEPNGAWTLINDAGMTQPTGGLYGYGVLINVDEGTNATYDAVAMDQFTDLVIHREPGSVQPGLGDALAFGQVLQADAAGATVVDFDTARGIDAVSAVLMHSSIMNDFVLEPNIDAGTDWVVTFPTKRQYVNADPVIAPFTRAWTPSTGLACESMSLQYWDREERSVEPDPFEFDFSPRPPTEEAVPFSLCREANVISFNDSNVLAASDRVRSDLTVIHDNGWMEVGFTGTGRTLPAVTVAGESIEFEGLPTVGFAVQKYVNGTLMGGTVLSNYAGTVQHKNKRSIIVSAP